MSKTIPPVAPAKGKGIDDFRASYDRSFIVPKRIKDGLAALGDSYESELEFMRRCGISVTDLSQYREPFAEFYIEVGGRNPKRLWAGTKAFAAKCRGFVQ